MSSGSARGDGGEPTTSPTRESEGGISITQMELKLYKHAVSKS